MKIDNQIILLYAFVFTNFGKIWVLISYILMVCVV